MTAIHFHGLTITESDPYERGYHHGARAKKRD